MEVNHEYQKSSFSKLRRRRQISEAAVTLFAERGFEAVTIAQIAEAAGVAKMTVTNHFSRKEDLVFDRLDEQVEEVATLLASRDQDRSILAVLRDYEIMKFESRSPLSGVTDSPNFWELVSASSVLLSRLHEHFRQLASVIANHLVQHRWEPPAARLEGELIGSVLSHIHFEALNRSANEVGPRAMILDQRQTIDYAFGRIDRVRME